MVINIQHVYLNLNITKGLLARYTFEQSTRGSEKRQRANDRIIDNKTSKCRDEHMNEVMGLFGSEVFGQVF